MLLSRGGGWDTACDSEITLEGACRCKSTAAMVLNTDQAHVRQTTAV